MSAEQYVIEAEWENPSLPRLIGPFSTRNEANEWARLNAENGSWNVVPLAYPYHRSDL